MELSDLYFHKPHAFCFWTIWQWLALYGVTQLKGNPTLVLANLINVLYIQLKSHAWHIYIIWKYVCTFKCYTIMFWNKMKISCNLLYLKYYIFWKFSKFEIIGPWTRRMFAYPSREIVQTTSNSLLILIHICINWLWSFIWSFGHYPVMKLLKYVTVDKLEQFSVSSVLKKEITNVCSSFCAIRYHSLSLLYTESYNNANY